jgi:hypothetical protein
MLYISNSYLVAETVYLMCDDASCLFIFILLEIYIQISCNYYDFRNKFLDLKKK